MACMLSRLSLQVSARGNTEALTENIKSEVLQQVALFLASEGWLARFGFGDEDIAPTRKIQTIVWLLRRGW